MKNNPHSARSVISTFLRTAGRRTHLWSLVVIEPTRGHDGKTYLSQYLYDVEWSRRFGYIFHMSGAGGFDLEVEGLYHVSGDLHGEKVTEKPCRLIDPNDRPPYRSAKTKAIRDRNKTRRIRLPKQFQGEPDVLAWLELNGINSDAVFCATCDDWLPGDNACDWCPHIWWCEKTGWYSTPSERCGCSSREQCQEATA